MNAASALVAIFVLSVSIAGCSNGGSGGPDDESLVLQLTTDAPCYGVAIDVNQSGLSEENRASIDDCTLDPAIRDSECTANVDSTADRLSLSVSGCSIANGAPLFNCTVPRPLAERIRESADTRCGCGCADDCPVAVATTVCYQNGEGCFEGFGTKASIDSGAQAEFGSIERTISPAQISASTSTTNHCGTCCDVYGIDTGVELFDEIAVSEIRFELAMPLEYPFCPEILECSTAEVFDGPTFVRERGDTLSVCLSAKRSVHGPLHLLSCSIISDGTERWRIAAIEALDERLRPVHPAPEIRNE